MLIGVLVIGLVDNVLRPILVGKDTRLPDYVVLVSTLGGISIFGINGFVIGPLIAALFIAAWTLFRGGAREPARAQARRLRLASVCIPAAAGLGEGRTARGAGMAFFQKLKERLFKSSSRIEEGIDAIIDEAPAARGALPAPRRPSRRRGRGSSGGSSARSAGGCSTTRCSRASRSC